MGQAASRAPALSLAATSPWLVLLGARYYQLRGDGVAVAASSWAAYPDLLRFLYRRVRRGGQRLVLECGSGVSTAVLGYGLRERGGGRVVALEHDPRYAAATRALLRDHRLQRWAEVRVAPLRPVRLAGESWPWYDRSALPRAPIDLLFVDGPPGTTRPHARFPALPLLYHRLADGAEVVLDDSHRPGERQVAQWWQERYRDLAAQELRHQKGTVLLHRR